MGSSQIKSSQTLASSFHFSQMSTLYSNKSSIPLSLSAFPVLSTGKNLGTVNTLHFSLSFFIPSKMSVKNFQGKLAIAFLKSSSFSSNDT